MKQIMNRKGCAKVIAVIATALLTVSGLGVGANIMASKRVSAAPACIEYAMFPNTTLNVSQVAYGNYSHKGKNVTDIVPNGRVKAPFSGTIRMISHEHGNYVILESDFNVRFADGTIGKMCIGLAHDNNVSDLWVGKHLNQGEEFYDKGTKADSSSSAKISGAHVHVAVFRGSYSSIKNKYNGNVYIYDALYLSSGTKVSKSGYASNKWRYLPKSAYPAAPAAVSNVRVSNIKKDRVTISWNKIAGPCIVYQIIDNGRVIATTSNTSYTHTGLKKQSTHTYQVRAVRNFFGVEAYGKYSGGVVAITKKK